jgi:soluble lytic murein transglycosylase-like protein
MISELLCIAVLNLGMPNANLACEHMEELVEASELHNVEPAVVISLIHYESRWTPTAVSRAGACGLTQVLPQYTKNPKLTCKQLKDPTRSIYAGAAALGVWVQKHKYLKGLCGYNAGYTCGKKYRKTHRGWRYARRVLRYSRKIAKELTVIQTQYEEDC